MTRFWKRWGRLALLLVLGITLSTAGVAAQDDLAAAGNGGTGLSSANGGAAALGDLLSGANVGNAIAAGDSAGDVTVSGGAVANATDVLASLDGGTGIADASGGEDNIAFTDDPAPAPAPADNDDGNDNDNGNERDFIVCVALATNPVVCGTGSCENQGGELICFPDDCAAIEPSFEPGCSFGGPDDPCVRVNDNRARCDVFV